MEIVNPEKTVRISEYYNRRNVFITGATGFLGKALIDKLLRSCPDIGNIYILLRPKKQKDITERLEVLLSDKLFDTLKQTVPHQLSKLKPIRGDCSEINLGLSEADYQTIISSVSVIYHVAASVRFDDPLKAAILLNTRGTREIAQLALRTTGLSILVHVSTTYCNSVMGDIIKEDFYPPPYDWRKAIKTAELDNGLLTEFGEKYLGPYRNTYTFTKALAEHVIKDLCEGNIPTIIIRPSVVINSVKDPCPGWVDNFNGPIGLLVACGKGLLRCTHLNPRINTDYIPVDIVVKATIVASWYYGLNRQLEEVEVIQVCSGYSKWMTHGELFAHGREMIKNIPFNNSFWVAKGFISNCPVYAYICAIFLNLVPALFMDVGLKLAGKKMIFMKIQKKIYIALNQVRYFNNNEWTFCNDKHLALKEKIHKEDNDVWSYDFVGSPELFLEIFLLGARRYLLNESDETLPSARLHYRRLYWLDKITMTILYGSLFWIAIYFGILHKFLNYFYNYVTYYNPKL